MAESCGEEWQFRGEGNACLVLTNTKEKMVYRLAKAKHWGKGHLYTTAKSKVDRIHEEMELVIDYMRNVMQPLLSPDFVCLPELRLTEGELPQEAELHIRGSRPAQRKGKDIEHSTIDPTTLSALVMPDMCYVRGAPALVHDSLPTISIEIKPKKAFMHLQDSLSVSSEEKSQVCKFCMHQRLKAKEGQWPETSRYCPLDLFSGNRQRMKQALLALADTPQNNLRICQNGEEVHGAWNKGNLNEVLNDFFKTTPNGVSSNGVHKQYKILHMFLELVLEALLYCPQADDFDNTRPDSNTRLGSNTLLVGSKSRIESSPTLATGSVSVQYCQNSSSQPDLHNSCNEVCNLPVGCVLSRILATQQLDKLDIDGVFPLYQQLEQHLKESPAARTELCIDGPFSGGDWYKACCDNSDSLLIQDPVTCMLNKVKRFLVSKTVQDCSIMVALQRVSEHENEASVGKCLKDTHGRRFRFSVSIIDLDPKPFCKIPAYHKQDGQIVSAYREATRETSFEIS